MAMIEEINKILAKNFSERGESFTFIDERGDGNHFYLEVNSSKFKGLSRLEKRRIIYKLLGEYLNTGKIHALRMKLNDN